MSIQSVRPRTPRVSIVIPAKNEARNLEIILPKLPEAYEVILIDGYSVDDTVEVARTLLPEIKIVQQNRRGKGNALACGFAQATGDVIVMFDADCSADPQEIPFFVHALVAGADFAKGSRFRPGGSSLDITPLRAAGNRVLNLVANMIFHTEYTDLCYGYNAFWADILDVLDMPAPDEVSLSRYAPLYWGDGFEIETLINCRIAAAGLVVREVPSNEQVRVHGASNLNAISDGWRVLKTINTERRRAATGASPRTGRVRVPSLTWAPAITRPLPVDAGNDPLWTSPLARSGEKSSR
jgi:glycosyltransferase involved in cell wall biosynthesis